MSEKKKNLSELKPESFDLSDHTRIGIVVSEWNEEITAALLNGARSILLQNHIQEKNIIVHYVPGSFELPLGSQYLIDYQDTDAVICLGCVIQGETRHFEFICQAVSQHIARLNLDHNLPVIFGVLTTDNFQQAKDRSGGKHGNKGDEAAMTALKMLKLRDDLSSKSHL